VNLTEHLRHDASLDPEVLVMAGDLAYLSEAADEIDRLTMEREENREVIGELEAELRSLRPSPGGVR
jgi:hypothetical protein